MNPGTRRKVAKALMAAADALESRKVSAGGGRYNPKAEGHIEQDVDGLWYLTKQGKPHKAAIARYLESLGYENHGSDSEPAWFNPEQYRGSSHEDNDIEGKVAKGNATTIPMADLLKAKKDLEKVLKPFQKYAGKSSSSPAAPDTSKFIATHSGFLAPAIAGEASYQLLGIKIGFNWFPMPEEMENGPVRPGDMARAKFYRDREAKLDEVKRAADTVIVPFMKKYGLDNTYKAPLYKFGSNYSTYGIPHERWMEVTR